MTVKPKLPDNKEKKGDLTTLIVSGIPETLKTEFKLHCVREGLSMSEVLVEVIHRLVSEGRILLAVRETRQSHVHDYKAKGG